MAGQTKLIIMTSDEDLIRRFSSNKTINTHIIDLDNNKHITTMDLEDDSAINLAYLAQLSELNSKNDHVYKRALHSPHHQQHRSRQLKSSKKKTDLICGICGDQAIGFNYDALSCSSCKAFFRRNANQPPEKVRCLTGQGQCSVAHETHRKCARCRLDRCFSVGMRKDFILSEEEKQERKKRLEENRNLTSNHSSTMESTSSSQSELDSESLSESLDEIDRLIADFNHVDTDLLPNENSILNTIENISLEKLSIDDWIVIQSVRSSFLSIFQCHDISCISFDVSDRASALISWSQFGHQLALRFINFFRQIDEFENLNSNDRFILVKYNLLLLFPISKCYSYKPINDCCSNDHNEASEKQRQFHMLLDDSRYIRESFVNIIHLLVDATGQDATLLSLLVATLMFSRGLSMNEDEPLLKDSLAVNRAQCHYTKVLWNYLVSKCGEALAPKQFTRLLNVTIQIQSAIKIMRDFFREQFITSNTVDKMAPLMQTILQIS